MRRTNGAWRAARGAAVAGGLWLGMAAAAGEVGRELEFASGLVEMGFPDFAERLIDRLVLRQPEAAERVRPVQVEILLSRRRFEEAERMAEGLLPGRPATDAAWLAIANGYYRIGEVERARRIYQGFFERFQDGVPESPDVRRFFMDAAYRFGQMLEQAGDLKGAAQAFERVLAAQPPEALLRRMQYELAALYVRTARTARPAEREPLFRKAIALCDKIQWGPMDLWFGRAIIPLAHIELIRGEAAAAERLIRSYLDILNEIEKLLAEQGVESALSPLAGARYLLGEINRQEAEKIEKTDPAGAIERYSEALRQFVNVFARYSDSEWGMEAGRQGAEVQARLEALGKTVVIRWGEHAARASAARFRMADDQFARGEYAEAAGGYLEILNRFPDTPQAYRALSNLLMCRVHLDETWEIRATAAHIAERYARVPDAGLALLVAGKHYFDADQHENYRYFYDLFLDAFPRHPRAPSIAFTMAGLLQRRGDEAGQRQYLERLIRDYEGDPYQHRALNMMAWNRYTAQDFEGAEALFRQVVEKSPPNHERAVAQFTLADCLVRLGRHRDAIPAFRTLESWLGTEAGRDNPYGASREEIERNRDLLEKARFFTGFSLSRIPADEGERAALRAEAIGQLAAFLRLYPASDLASRAMSLIGSMQVELGRAEDAAGTFEELARRYPDSEEGRNALFSLIRAAVEIGRLDTARDAFARMMAGRGDHGADSILRVAQTMLEAGLHEESYEGFGVVLAADPTDRPTLERALYGRGRSAYETGRFAEAIEPLRTLVELFPNTGLLFEARFTLARAHRDSGRLEEAVEALRDVFERGASDPVLGNTANIELARMQSRLADRAAGAGDRARESTWRRAAAASYQRVALFGDPRNPALRPLVRESLIESVRLFIAIGEFRDAVDTSDQFLRDFPEREEVPEVRRLRAEANLKIGTR